MRLTSQIIYALSLLPVGYAENGVDWTQCNGWLVAINGKDVPMIWHAAESEWRPMEMAIPQIPLDGS